MNEDEKISMITGAIFAVLLIIGLFYFLSIAEETNIQYTEEWECVEWEETPQYKLTQIKWYCNGMGYLLEPGPCFEYKTYDEINWSIVINENISIEEIEPLIGNCTKQQLVRRLR